jgi:hypothetical protein
VAVAVDAPVTLTSARGGLCAQQRELGEVVDRAL